MHYHPLGSAHREDFSQKILKASESGALQSLKTEWWPTGDCLNTAIVGSTVEKSLQVDIPHVGK